jgi:hypothetical protein
MLTNSNGGTDPWEAHETETTENGESLHGKFTTAEAALQYMMAGKATVTLKSKATGTRFTYRLNLKKGDPAGQFKKDITMVALMTGPDNNSSFQYIGHFFSDRNYKHGRKSRVGYDAPAAKAFAWTWSKLTAGELPESLEVWHAGTCGRCGRKLTVPESVASGFGPECINHVHHR